MALQVELKPGERVFIGDSLITNPQERIRIYVGGDAPILRERDVLLLEDATTPARRIYFALQMMYLDRGLSAARSDFLALVRDFLDACPSASDKIASISYHVLMGNLYKGMKETRHLIEYEDHLLNGLQQWNGGASIASDAASPCGTRPLSPVSLRTLQEPLASAG